MPSVFLILIFPLFFYFYFISFPLSLVAFLSPLNSSIRDSMAYCVPDLNFSERVGRLPTSIDIWWPLNLFAFASSSFFLPPPFLVLFNISVKMSLDSWDRAKPARMPVLYIPYYIQSGMTFFAFWFGSIGSRAWTRRHITEGLAASSFCLIRFSKHSGKRGCVY